MALENITLPLQDISSNIIDSFINLPGVSLILNLAKIAGILVIIYIIFLILKAISGWKSASRLKNITKSVEQINQKLDLLIGKKKKIKN